MAPRSQRRDRQEYAGSGTPSTVPPMAHSPSFLCIVTLLLCPEPVSHLHPEDVVCREILYLLLTVLHKLGLQCKQEPAPVGHTFPLRGEDMN